MKLAELTSGLDKWRVAVKITDINTNLANLPDLGYFLGAIIARKARCRAVGGALHAKLSLAETELVALRDKMIKTIKDSVGATEQFIVKEYK